MLLSWIVSRDRKRSEKKKKLVRDYVKQGVNYINRKRKMKGVDL